MLPAVLEARDWVPVADEAPDTELPDPAPVPVAAAEFDGVAVAEVAVVAVVVGKPTAP